ncbi:hypothetical protein [Pseudobutyrivibrio sp.]|uniref:hypothetical protein n=1 Tax=Pseudobutyrivibrio sp. TaxID=2014367 RepID=UPI001B47B6FD|nr:hypothetical protein [Pseudobutyrivibrio sp.]MBP3261163.1 hypothetical protein [Pseudobutyrivibrio sp.]
METVKTEGGVFIFENCTINIYEMGNKTRDEVDVELSDDEEMEEGFLNPFEEAVNHAIDVLKGVSNGE